MDRQSYLNRKQKDFDKQELKHIKKYIKDDIRVLKYNPKHKTKYFIKLNKFFRRVKKNFVAFFNPDNYKIVRYTPCNNHVWINHNRKGLIRVQVSSLTGGNK